MNEKRDAAQVAAEYEAGAADVHDPQGTLVDRGGEGACFGSITLTDGAGTEQGQADRCAHGVLRICGV